MRSKVRRSAPVLGLLALLLVGLVALEPGVAGASTPSPTVAPRSSRMRVQTRAAYGVPIAAGHGATEGGRPQLRPNTLGAGRATWTSASLPSSTFGFDAIPRIGGNWPADPTGAVGDDWFFTAVNSSYALYDLTGNVVVGPNPLVGLFDVPKGTQLFDPKIVYDPYDDTFVLVFLGVNDGLQRSWLLVLTIPNASAGDPSTWCGARIVGDRTAGDGRQFAEYPGLGYDGDRVTITSNQYDFAGGGFRFAQILSFPKSSLYDCSHSLQFSTFAGADTRNPDGTQAFTIQPATTVGGTSPHAQYLLSFEDGRPNFVVVWKLKRTAAGVELSNGAVEVRQVRIGPYGTQGGGSVRNANTWWDPGDLRFVNAFYDAGLDRLYAANAVAKNLQPDPTRGGYVESVVHWYEIQPGAKPKLAELTRSGYVGAPEVDSGWGVVATDAAGNLYVTYSRGSAVTGEFLSAWVAEIPPGTNKAQHLLLAAGTARFEAIKGVERWGDYNAISRDPVAGAFVATVNQYAVADGGASTVDWQQTVDVVRHAA